MVSCQRLYEIFKSSDIFYFTGVPDSILKDWISYLEDNRTILTNRIASNEGAAIAHATGYYLSTGKLGVVYFQNSGLGNCVNPLTSLTNREVFSIPMILMIGWRGQPGYKDEPQHYKMGRVMLHLLEALHIPYEILDERKIDDQIRNAKENAFNYNAPASLIVKKGLLSDYCPIREEDVTFPMTREDAIKSIVDTFDGNELVISTTGKTSRELFDYRKHKGQHKDADLYTIGSMGHSAAIAMEIAKQKPDRIVYIFDGDGSLIMHTGTLATIGYYAPRNLVHIVFDNNSYESTGSQPTVSDSMDIASIALACGYSYSNICIKEEELMESLNHKNKGPLMVVVKVRKGSRRDLGRPDITPSDNKIVLMKNLSN